jgi:hypothetical protein
MIRVEKDDNIRRILEALLNELLLRKLLEPSTIQDIINEGRSSATASHTTLPPFYVEWFDKKVYCSITPSSVESQENSFHYLIC